MKIGVLLVNLGTPDSYSVPDVRKYLREFLMDYRVIDIPTLSRWLLVNLIIAPFRSPKSAKLYNELWQERGSPLKYYGYDVMELLQNKLGTDYIVKLGMRYQSPSIQDAVQDCYDSNVDKIILLPLFPQYASATTGSVVEKVMEIIRKKQNIVGLSTINSFYDHPLFIKTIVSKANTLMQKKKYEHFVFSYHGIPERQIHKASQGRCSLGKCCDKIVKNNTFCYRAQCFATTRQLVKALGLEEGTYTTCFQSRLGKSPWIQPYAEDTIKELAKKGIKDVLAFSPAFIADCLETTLEVGDEFKEYFLEAGGNTWDLVPSLNDSPYFVECLYDLVQSHSQPSS